MPKAVQAAYIHVPFCLQKCNYCDFASFVGSREQMAVWSQRIRLEIRQTRAWLRESEIHCTALTSIYFGGGTPSNVPPDDIALILGEVDRTFGIQSDCECTLEANPGSVASLLPYKRSDWRMLRMNGINRVSVGVQSFSDHLLAKLGRIHRAADVEPLFELLSDADIPHKSLDLMIGLPGQTLQDVEDALTAALRLPIDHMSYYSLILEPGTPFYERYGPSGSARYELPLDEEERAMYHRILDRLTEENFIPYEISNAAKPGCESRHNLAWH